MIRRLRSVDRYLVLIALPLALAGCREKAVSYYEVPHEAPAPTPGMPPAMAGARGAAASHDHGPSLEWTRPAAWSEKPASEMRLASYGFTDADGSEVDVSIFSFPDAAGGLLANINRWRGQVGLSSVPEDALETTAQRVQIAGQAAWLVDFAGTPTGGSTPMGAASAASGPTRITGAIVPVSGKAWFFKMMGPDAAVAAQRANFDALVASVRAVTPAASADPHAGIPGAPPLSAPGAADPHAGVAGAPPLSGAAASAPGVMDPSAIPPPPSPPGGFTFETPVGWTAGAPSQFRLASFTIPNDAGSAATVAVTNFPGDVGGDFANVNRWRGQIGLPPVDETTFRTLIERVDGADGLQFLVVDFEGPPAGDATQRLTAAILKQPDSTFFFKMNGETSHVAAQREAFIRFIKSFRLQPAP